MTPRFAPFSPLVAGGAGLDRAPTPPVALRKRMSEVYGVVAECVLIVRGAEHGLTLTDGGAIVASPGARGEPVLNEQRAREAAASGLVVVDERFVEFADAPSLATVVDRIDNLVVLRSLEYAYGLLGAPCAALIASPRLIERLSAKCELAPLAAPVVKLAEAALDPVRAALHVQRIDEVKRERARLCAVLANAPAVRAAVSGAGPFVFVTPANETQSRRDIARCGAAGDWLDSGVFRLDVGDADKNGLALAAFGVSQPDSARRSEAVRETNETKVAVLADLAKRAPVFVSTGLEFYDHMLSQIAVHGGFSLSLACEGDLGVDPHHTVEDCALALGQALSQALGERRGIARYGFVLPMDEALAQVSIDLGGRPYLIFEGAFSAPLLGAYPTEMTEHVFRSLAQTLGAAIHVSVKGKNDHHMTEACFKAFGRALRQAMRIESDAIPSSKGVI
jgi:histidinol-phosphate aminotransferase/imidazoleglycerol-phosphate dehydratase/histidinol-phosphatase